MTILDVQNIAKSFTLHLRGGLTLPVVAGVSFDVAAGECVALGGPSGAGKSSILKMIFGNYRTDAGCILIHDGGTAVDIAKASPREVLALRATTVGYVSQFLRVIPRVAALDIVAEPLRARGVDAADASERAAAMLRRLNLPERLWRLPPATFSGGEQQRVNIARGFIAETRLLLLDEPTASLDGVNRDAVIQFIRDKAAAGTALVGIFHDAEVRDAVADRTLDVRAFAAA
ncbi:Alpha-D-ribose 1-methylphosphonate 5-triphosphate synthase subunit PhnL [Blastochloris viridis]|uniref:Phosphonates transport ATP-binding protein PhnL n=2 Tax=Blastochloris viridis TaxID=1079 RepID=A0A0H5BFT5_BLAVI|nr:phosphonate C-P lyase system protein PhnL [Blastochloris viridis]ALK09070.1 Alpha-D-ribose 1-methylphosphonate 5-triphosphate synthase subunit PhnL [Blastochloris viridis]BAS01068.1 phosphonates transport ATP-binding protein PhnL [Blastochloris viridis]CUU41732.1 putative ABC transporter ATP-binding protein/MT0079 [Blastochloris viridis]